MIDDLRRQLAALEPFDTETAFARDSILRALEVLDAPFDRDAHPMHLTASAFVVGPRGVLLHRHKRMDLWLQVGGHIDEGERAEDAVLREASEESGLVVTHPEGGPRLVHVSIHAAPHGHIHLDLRYLLEADGDPAPGPGESEDVRWFAWDVAPSIAAHDLGPALAGLRRALGR